MSMSIHGLVNGVGEQTDEASPLDNHLAESPFALQTAYHRGCYIDSNPEPDASDAACCACGKEKVHCKNKFKCSTRLSRCSSHLQYLASDTSPAPKVGQIPAEVRVTGCWPNLSFVNKPAMRMNVPQLVELDDGI